MECSGKGHTFLDDEIRFGRLTINTHRRYVKTKLPY